MSHTVKLPWDPLWRPLKWAKDNCPSYITNKRYIPPLEMNTQHMFYQPLGREAMRLDSNGNLSIGKSDEYIIEYFFYEEKDAILFALRWS